MLKRFLSSKLTLLAALVLLVVSANAKYRQWQRQHLIELEKGRLSAQIKQYEDKNRELKESLSYFSSPDFADKLARRQLNLKRPGETVYNFGQPPSATPQTTKGSARSASNPERWLRYFLDEPY